MAMSRAPTLLRIKALKIGPVSQLIVVFGTLLLTVDMGLPYWLFSWLAGAMLQARHVG